jgi:hypothetical protein
VPPSSIQLYEIGITVTTGCYEMAVHLNHKHDACLKRRKLHDIPLRNESALCSNSCTVTHERVFIFEKYFFMTYVAKSKPELSMIAPMGLTVTFSDDPTFSQMKS